MYRLFIITALTGLMLPTSLTLGQAGTGNYFDPATWDAPTGYYASASSLTGSALESALHDIISVDYYNPSSTQHRYVPYADAGAAFDVLDRVAPQPNPFTPWDLNIIYETVDVSVIDTTPRNREHVWAASRQQTSSPRNELGHDYPDLHNLRPAFSATNSARSNLNFGGTGGASSGYSSGYWYPGDEHKGDVARMLFYMAVRYDGSESNTADLTLVNGNPGAWNAQHGDLASLLQWHIDDPVSDFERRRNHLIFTDSFIDEFGNLVDNRNGSTGENISQGNRNPFVDNPGWVSDIWGGPASPNDTQLSVDTPAADGSSSETVGFGRVMKNSSLTPDVIALNKTGSESTSALISESGGASVTPDGSYAFGAGNSSVNLNVTIDTSSTGDKNGTITIDNLASNSAGTGLGSADANDTISVSGTVVEKRVIIEYLAADLGTTIVGGTVSGTSNLLSNGTNSQATSVELAETAGPNGDGIEVIGGVRTIWDDGRVFGSRDFGGAFTSAGAKSGTVGLAVTTLENGGLGLTGEGTYADVQVSYTGTALDHANASFISPADQNVLNIDLGNIFVGSADPTTGFDIYNLLATASYTADLDLDAVVGSGDTASLFTNVVSGVSISAGSSLSYQATLDTASIGDFAATWTIQNSDEDLPGAVAGTNLVINLTGLVTYVGDFEFDLDLDATDIDLMFDEVLGSASDSLYDLTGDTNIDSADTDYLVHTVFNTEYGDANLDGKVDVLDLSLLATNYGTSGSWATADFNGDGVIDVLDLSLLAANYNFDNGSSALPVPEPVSIALLGLAGMVLLSRRQ